ncbi:hypothetical protein P152DRAFT_418172 [Eremomyces bilateralis CBS 781.70]|uniref:BTB domain-containing protein n=1 Tax=Eremomyces bilateralis CBS 781.70 TaxID=1392243 RepID=A0A6G1G2H4_9PEZI|nr:uncharacterized protein P152DRAFT_418172 [Eremomyces bilateralis CBS 781.70]KAF1812126.1 hypothetical protein P152DRAFT_418172 [Eremomyces bilateralis CBS 781.70]
MDSSPLDQDPSQTHGVSVPFDSIWQHEAPPDHAPSTPIGAGGPSNTPRRNTYTTPHTSIFNSSTSTFPPSLFESNAEPSPGEGSSSIRANRPLDAFGRDVERSTSPSIAMSSGTARISAAEKDVDDPTTPVDHQRAFDAREEITPITPAKSMAADVPLNPSSRTSSYQYGAGNLNLLGRTNYEPASLPDHLYTRGLLGGRHSDITVIAFGTKYNLHRLLLDRAPFFATALSEPWIESSLKEVTLHPEDMDSNITQVAFELALKRLYGCDISNEEEAEAIGLFATGCWLEMPDLAESAIDAILRQMNVESLAPLIKLVTENYYGRSGERILASAKAMLCRDGWEMHLRYWDGIPGDIVREIVGGDGCFVYGEWDRWVLAKRLLDRRLKQKAAEVGLGDKIKNKSRAPETLGLMAIRFDPVYRKNSISSLGQSPEGMDKWLALYTHPEVEPLLVLLDEGIHYVHLEFEQLQHIRRARDVFGLPLLPEDVITNALWMAMELRQKVVNARDLDMDLGLSIPAEIEPTKPPTVSSQRTDDANGSSVAQGKRKVDETPSQTKSEEMGSGSWDSTARPRKFWIPSADCNIVMGGNAEPVIQTSAALSNHASQISVTIQPEDAPWATDFASSPGNITEGLARSSSNATRPQPSDSAGGTTQPKPIAYSHCPPFRFAVEFPNPRLLKEKKRVYSRTVFYAGSLWNIYIQKVRSSKHPQLGVYLHRAKEREVEEALSGPGLAANLSNSIPASVDERIGQLEREMLLRGDRRRVARDRDRDRPLGGLATDNAAEEDTSGSGGDVDANTSRSYNWFSNYRPGGNTHNSYRARQSSVLQHYTPVFDIPSDSDSDNDADASSNYPRSANTAPQLPLPQGLSATTIQPNSQSPSPTLARASISRNNSSRQPTFVATVPPYTDMRPTIRTYFKIYSPSKGGRLLSVYESAPDRFNFSQSWGWKSSTLMLDEGLIGGGEGAVSGEEEGSFGQGAEKRRREGKLRFMVVIGNL